MVIVLRCHNLRISMVYMYITSLGELVHLQGKSVDRTG